MICVCLLSKRTTAGHRGNPAVKLQHNVPTASLSVILWAADVSEAGLRGVLANVSAAHWSVIFVARFGTQLPIVP
jgi:hypothetical protein